MRLEVTPPWAAARLSRAVDAAVHVGIHHARKRDPVARVVGFPGALGGDVRRQACETPALDRDIEIFQAVPVGARHAHVLDQQIEFMSAIGHWLAPRPLGGRKYKTPAFFAGIH